MMVMLMMYRETSLTTVHSQNGRKKVLQLHLLFTAFQFVTW